MLNNQQKFLGIKELARMDILEAQISNNGSITKEQFIEILNKYFSEVPETLPEDLTSLILTTTKEYGEYEINIAEIYNGEFLDTNNYIYSYDIANNPSEYYGQYVIDYDCTNKDAVERWQIFYADNENIYLISEDTIDNSYVPDSPNYEVYRMDDIQVTFTTVVYDYDGMANIQNPDIIKWLKFRNQYPNSEYKNSKAVAYLLDTSIWNVFAGEKAQYAVGAPTLDLFATSYNEINTDKIEYLLENDIGYNVTQGSINTDSAYNMYGDDNLYWIASPAQSANNVITVKTTGVVASNDFTYTPAAQGGIRPIVCLKNTAKLLRNSDGTYSIY